MIKTIRFYTMVLGFDLIVSEKEESETVWARIGMESNPLLSFKDERNSNQSLNYLKTKRRVVHSPFVSKLKMRGHFITPSRTKL